MTYGFHQGWGSGKERWRLAYLKRKLAGLERRLPDPHAGTDTLLDK